VELWSLFTHEEGPAPWKLNIPETIRPVFFGAGESVSSQGSAGAALSEWRKGARITRWCREKRIRAVIVFGCNDLTLLRTILWCRIHRVPCFLFGDSNLLGDHPRGLRAALKGPFMAAVIGCCSGMFYCGRLGRAYFKKYGAKPGRMFQVPYEPNYAIWENVPDLAIAAARVYYGISPDRRHILYCGRLAPEKRVDTLLAAFAALADQRPQWDLIVAGDGPLRRRLMEQVPTDIRQRVIWTGFINEEPLLAALFANSDLFVLPSDYEPWGVVVTEAAVRLPLICSSSVGAAADLVEEGQNGFVFPAGDAGALHGRLLEATEPAKLAAMKLASPAILSSWRRTADPIDGIRRALAFAGCLPDAAMSLVGGGV
jgi:glycosyltransferase involved in cell wall biosynthesis